MKKNASYYKSKNKQRTATIKRSYYPSENNRLTRIYEKNESKTIENIVCISLEAKLKGKWKTIIFYDTAHGYLHKHERFSLRNDSYSISTIGVKRKGTKEKLLNWSVKDLHQKYIFYKRRFLKRSGFSKSEILFNLY